MLFSALIAGPVGLAMAAGELAAEKVTGLDPEKIGDRMLAKIGVRGTEVSTKIVAAKIAQAHAITAQAAEAPTTSPWSPSQLAAYGVTTSSGGLKLGRLQGSDVLNSLELDKLQARQAAARYAATAV